MTVDDFILMQPFLKEVSRLSAPIIPFTNEVAGSIYYFLKEKKITNISDT